jgi:hypothetical protein
MPDKKPSPPSGRSGLPGPTPTLHDVAEVIFALSQAVKSLDGHAEQSIARDLLLEACRLAVKPRGETTKS